MRPDIAARYHQPCADLGQVSASISQPADRAVDACAWRRFAGRRKSPREASFLEIVVLLHCDLPCGPGRTWGRLRAHHRTGGVS